MSRSYPRPRASRTASPKSWAAKAPAPVSLPDSSSPASWSAPSKRCWVLPPSGRRSPTRSTRAALSSRASAASKRCSRTAPTRSRPTPHRPTRPPDFRPTTPWSPQPASRPACSPASVGTPTQRRSWPTWPWWICLTTQTRWVPRCRTSRTPIRALRSRTTPCSTTSSWATAVRRLRCSGC